MLHNLSMKRPQVCALMIAQSRSRLRTPGHSFISLAQLSIMTLHSPSYINRMQKSEARYLCFIHSFIHSCLMSLICIYGKRRQCFYLSYDSVISYQLSVCNTIHLHSRGVITTQREMAPITLQRFKTSLQHVIIQKQQYIREVRKENRHRVVYECVLLYKLHNSKFADDLMDFVQLKTLFYIHIKCNTFRGQQSIQTFF